MPQPKHTHRDGLPHFLDAVAAHAHRQHPNGLPHLDSAVSPETGRFTTSAVVAGAKAWGAELAKPDSKYALVTGKEFRIPGFPLDVFAVARVEKAPGASVESFVNTEAVLAGLSSWAGALEKDGSNYELLTGDEMQIPGFPVDVLFFVRHSK